MQSIQPNRIENKQLIKPKQDIKVKLVGKNNIFDILFVRNFEKKIRPI